MTRGISFQGEGEENPQVRKNKYWKEKKKSEEKKGIKKISRDIEWETIDEVDSCDVFDCDCIDWFIYLFIYYLNQ